MLMYYDARPSALNGLFDFCSLRPLKGYFAIRMFSELYKLNNEVESRSDEKAVHVLAATKDGKTAALITHYSADKNKAGEWVTIKYSDIKKEDRIRYYLVDENYTMYERKADLNDDGEIKIYMEPNSFALFTNYCIND